MEREHPMSRYTREMKGKCLLCGRKQYDYCDACLAIMEKHRPAYERQFGKTDDREFGP
jgi:hypothetical protein